MLEPRLIGFGSVQVQELQHLVARATAMDALRRHERFQEDMRDAHVRSCVDAVIDNPENVTRLRDQHAMQCLGKLRQLRDATKPHGGGAINIDEAMRPWTAKDDERVAGGAQAVILRAIPFWWL